MRKIIKKSQQEITAEWDALALSRFNQVMTGKDITFTYVLSPAIISLIPKSCRSVLDAGCGVGILTKTLSARFQHVVGIDPSAKSIQIAKKNFSKFASFRVSTIEDFASQKGGTFDAVVANMVLMDVINLKTFLNSAAHILNKNGKLIFTITNPHFWPAYYGYDHFDWFNYDEESIVEAPFRISKSSSGGLNSTHVHRPVESYIRELKAAGFTIEHLDEVMPPHDIQKLYPAMWKNPRYIVGHCTVRKGRWSG